MKACIFVDRWWKKWSAQLLLVAIGIAEASQFIPELREFLPPEWYRAVFLVAFVARIINQRQKPPEQR